MHTDRETDKQIVNYRKMKILDHKLWEGGKTTIEVYRKIIDFLKVSSLSLLKTTS